MLFRVQKDKENPYVMINKSFLFDKNLSAKAKGILAYLLCLPDDWKIYLEELSTHFKDGVKSITAGVNELMDNGYILRTTLRDEKGKFKGYMYDVFEVSPETPKTENGKTEFRKRQTTNKTLELNNKKQNNNTHTDLKNVCAEAQKILGEKISEKKLQQLINTASIETVKEYLNNWDKYKPFARQGQVAYFIYCVQNKVPIPTQQQATSTKQQANNKPYANFEQRSYTEDDYEQFFDNVKKSKGGDGS